MRISLVLVFFTIVLVASGQSTRSAGTKPPAPTYQAAKKEKFSFRGLFKKDDKGQLKTGIETQKEFEQRMKAVARAKSKEARKADKPEYSNPFYFGHKRPPKKRPVGKRKYCKICEFAH